ncbi:MAG: hypothetical protein PHH85_02205 [Candidatus Methanoperedens sp.]|nr:hypothetical protein [Candidatus Methanoperedens sp.]
MQVKIIAKTYEAERELRFNIAFLAKEMIKRGFKTEDMDKAAQDCRDYVEKRVKEMGITDAENAANMENLFITIMMHTALTDTIKDIEFTATTKGVSKEVVLAELVAENEEIFTQNEVHIEKG